MIHIIAFNLFFACCLIYCLRVGGGPERAAILSQAIAVLLTIIIFFFSPMVTRWNGRSALVLVDIALLVSLTLVALKANRYWTIILAGLQLSTVLVHLSKALVPALPAASYAIFAQFWAWPMLVTTLAGAWKHRLRLKTYGHERDWRPLWPHLAQTDFTI